VVKETLSESMIKAGAVLTRTLDSLDLPVTASMWFFFPEENQWRLLLSSPYVVKEGPKRTYRLVQEALSKLPVDAPKIILQDIVVTDESHPIISLMRIAVKTGDGIGGVRFSKNVINGQIIEDAYIYRLQ
jgi:hypothetical protein